MKYEITKEQIKQLSLQDQIVEEYLEEWFPEAFETKLEVGKWYKMKRNSQVIFCVTSIFNNVIFAYGINYKGEWFNNSDDDNQIGCTINFHLYTNATESEVFEALKKEAVKRGLCEGAVIKNHQGRFTISNFNINDLTFSDTKKTGNTGIWYRQNVGIWLMINGKWAEIIKEKTLSKSEAEAKLNELINDGYAYKIG